MSFTTPFIWFKNVYFIIYSSIDDEGYWVSLLFIHSHHTLINTVCYIGVVISIKSGGDNEIFVYMGMVINDDFYFILRPSSIYLNKGLRKKAISFVNGWYPITANTEAPKYPPVYHPLNLLSVNMGNGKLSISVATFVQYIWNHLNDDYYPLVTKRSFLPILALFSYRNEGWILNIIKNRRLTTNCLTNYPPMGHV